MTQWKSVEQYLRNTNQQKSKNWLDHPFFTLMRSSTKLGKWRSDSFRGEQTHICILINLCFDKGGNYAMLLYRKKWMSYHQICTLKASYHQICTLKEMLYHQFCTLQSMHSNQDNRAKRDWKHSSLGRMASNLGKTPELSKRNEK